MRSNEATTRGSETARAWANDQAERVGVAVRELRVTRGLSASQLSARTSHVGFPITRATIAKIESNSRSAKLDVAEIQTLAAALEVAPLELLFPGLISRQVDIFPGRQGDSLEATLQFTGEFLTGFDFSEIPGDPSVADVDDRYDWLDNLGQSGERLGLARQWQELLHQAMELEDRIADLPDTEPVEHSANLLSQLAQVNRLLEFLLARMRSLGMEVDR
ncbi:helix-turn-helix domain-containing protein [Rhodococcus sp. EPR-134]|uniref:helix-turn-helix domain-containing protein n=1 Tax=Rhodococcus sp. EPR-134 TaxID=1813675 RepID=UPI0012E7911B|nr:helix-turn-helix transcriptional regulator [Rhodococcus sp. EPR-134]